jgi:autocrine motility factor receptor
MGITYLHISVATTALSFVGLQVWTELSLDRLRADGIITKNISLGNSENTLELLLSSHTTIALLASFVLNIYILLVLSLKVRVVFYFRG